MTKSNYSLISNEVGFPSGKHLVITEELLEITFLPNPRATDLKVNNLPPNLNY